MIKYKYFSGDIKKLQSNEIFVFGSNEAGIHGSGAAKTARDLFGAVLGQGIGFTGQCYGIPTKDKNIQTLPLNKIQFYVNNFLHQAYAEEDTIFIVTQIGCGLAGYEAKDIAPMFNTAPRNCMFDVAWHEYLEHKILR